MIAWPTLSSFRRRPACMDAVGRAVSGTKAEESSGLISHSCSTGMTIHGHDNRMRHPLNPAVPSLPRPACSRRRSTTSAACSRRGSITCVLQACIHAGVDSSLRWNDNGGHKTQTGNLKCHFCPHPSFRRRPESSGFNKPFPQYENDNTRTRQSNAPSAKPCRPFTPPAGLLPTPLYHFGRLFQTRLYHLRPAGVHPCRRGFQPALE